MRGMCLSLIAGACLLAAGCREQPPAIVLTTTTSVVNSGLLDRLVPAYERESGRHVRALPVGSGRALRLLEVGQADAVISHAPQQEAEALSRHRDWSYRKVLYNDFLIAGPPGDPAGVRAAADAADALRRIAASGSRWVSRGDESGTDEREKQLWQAAGGSPAVERLVTSGQGMGATLRVASEMEAYTLTDRGSFEQLAPRLGLVEIYSGDARLLNTYAVLAASANPEGSAFAAWLAEGGGRRELERLIASGDLRGFLIWPSDSPGASPDAVPRGQVLNPR